MRTRQAVATRYRALLGQRHELKLQCVPAESRKTLLQWFTFTGSLNYQNAFGVGYSVNEAAGFGGRIPQDPRNYRAERARFNFDQRFRFVFTNVREIPFLRNRNDPVGLLFGGWAIKWIVQLTSGLPVNVTQNGNSHNTGGDSSPRPHIATCLMSLSWSHTSVAGSVTSPSHRIQLPRGQFSSSERHFRVTARRDSCFAIVTASSVASSLSGSKNGHPAVLSTPRSTRQRAYCGASDRNDPAVVPRPRDCVR